MGEGDCALSAETAFLLKFLIRSKGLLRGRTYRLIPDVSCMSSGFLHSKSYSNNCLTKSLYVPSLIKPIFILGMPRSGTSLVEQIISSHHKVYGAGELKSLNNIIASLTKHNTFIESENLSEKNIFSIREKYLESLANLNISENIITDKWPLNFKNIGFILSAFPEAKIVHLKRDTTATCWSIYKHYFSDSGNGWAYNLDDLAQFYNLYEDLMEFWHELYPNKIYDISYEDLTTNQEEETRKLLEYCDLEWDEDCLNFHTNNRAVETASSLQVREKMYRGSSEVWKQYWTRIQPLIDGLKSYKNINEEG